MLSPLTRDVLATPSRALTEGRRVGSGLQAPELTTTAAKVPHTHTHVYKYEYTMYTHTHTHTQLSTMHWGEREIEAWHEKEQRRMAYRTDLLAQVCVCLCVSKPNRPYLFFIYHYLYICRVNILGH